MAFTPTHIIFYDFELDNNVTKQRHRTIVPRCRDFSYAVYKWKDDDDTSIDSSAAAVPSIETNAPPQFRLLERGKDLNQLIVGTHNYPHIIYVAHNGLLLDFRYHLWRSTEGRLSTLNDSPPLLLSDDKCRFFDPLAFIRSNKIIKNLLNNTYDCYQYTNTMLYNQVVGGGGDGAGVDLALFAHSAQHDVAMMVKWFYRLKLDAVCRDHPQYLHRPSILYKKYGITSQQHLPAPPRQAAAALHWKAEAAAMKLCNFQKL